MPLNEKQQSAVEYLDGPLLVLAGPGTGKTQLLANKVEFILNQTDTNPSNILCLTFTEAGVTAMRERLLSMRVASANQVNISTYHAFGTQIIAEYKNYAETFTRNLDQSINPVTQYKIIKSILASLPATDILRSGDIDINTHNIIDTINNAKSARLTPSDILKIAETNISETKKLNPLLATHLENLKPRIKFADACELVYLPLAQTLAEHISSEPIAGQITREANHLLLSLQEIIAEEEAKEKPSISPLTKWKNSNFEKDSDGNFRLKNRISNKKLLSFATVYEKYNTALCESGNYDFSDMIEEAITALKNDHGFRATLQERYQYILLDEFQDTNPSQFEMIRLLTDYESPSIMAVGDDDQAIYAFQGANASNLIDFYNTYQAKIITLTDNYRSTSEILDFSRQIAEQIDSSFAKNRNIDKVLTSIRNDEILPKSTSSSFISRHEFPSSDNEFAWIASEINKLINSGVPQKEIAIISSKHKNLLPLIPYLKRYENINISYEKRENILEDELIVELCTIARFIYELSMEKNPSHRLLEILSFEFWGIEPIVAMNALESKFRDQRRALDYLSKSENKELQEIAQFFAELTAKSQTTPLAELLQLIIDRMGENMTEAKLASFYENLAVLYEHLVSYIETSKPRLADFISFLDDYATSSTPILNSSPYQDSADSIQVLSAHKSKGLEYQYVFLISVDDVTWGKGKGNNNQFTLPINLIPIRHTGITEDEQLRLLFVAATRAKLGLIMTNSVQNFAGQKPNRLEYLQEYSVDDKSIASPLLPNPDVVEHDIENDPFAKLENLETYWLSHYFALDSTNKASLIKRLENYRMTASDLTTFIDLIYGGPLEFYKRKVLRAPSEPATLNIHLGNLIHSTFEHITNGQISTAEAPEFFTNQLSELDLTESEARDLKDQGLYALEVSLKTFSDILCDKNARAEVDLSREHLSVAVPDPVPITGKIDHIHINDEDKTIEIYDFKTSSFHDCKWESNASLYKYSFQLGFYKLLLNASPTYKNYRISKAHILFVTPDVDGLVHDKVFEFTEDFEAQLKSLISRIYKEISTLDFIDENHPLHIFADKTNNVKNIREFVATLTEK